MLHLLDFYSHWIRMHGTTSLKKKNNKYYIFWVCVCRLRYRACNAHAPNCHLCSVLRHHIFSRYLINGAIFGKVFLNAKCALSISTTFVRKCYNSKKKWEWYDHKCMFDFIQICICLHIHICFSLHKYIFVFI